MEKINDKLFNWASMLDINAQLQAEKCARLPFVERVALMPDAHVGMGATVGSVIGTNGAIIPSAVGVDIGCGMMALQWDMTADELPDNLDAFMPMVEGAIPAGVGQGNDQASARADTWWRNNWSRFQTDIDKDLTKKALTQFGSLGSGNHFFEICLDENDGVWFVLHSGSRGLGNIVASRHIKEAKRLNAELNRKLEDTDLAYFLESDTGFNAYISDMLACQDYAAANRDQMMRRVKVAWLNFLDRTVTTKMSVNCHHNFTEPEVHDGKRIWVTRKGAIKAETGSLGVIPGSMGTRSYIVRGLGNADSFCSCSHGAGRVHSRSAAKKLFTTDDLRASMEGKVWNANKADALVDEIPQSYKDIDVVMEDQKDLVAPIFQLRQILNYKGV